MNLIKNLRRRSIDWAKDHKRLHRIEFALSHTCLSQLDTIDCNVSTSSWPMLLRKKVLLLPPAMGTSTSFRLVEDVWVFFWERLQCTVAKSAESGETTLDAQAVVTTMLTFKSEVLTSSDMALVGESKPRDLTVGGKAAKFAAKFRILGIQNSHSDTLWHFSVSEIFSDTLRIRSHLPTPESPALRQIRSPCYLQCHRGRPQQRSSPDANCRDRKWEHMQSTAKGRPQ